MSATEELRALLDERGVKWWEGESYVANAVTLFTVRGVKLRYVDYGDYCWLDYHEDEPLTPEQAIAATLGGGECERVKYGTKPDGTPRWRCSVCGYGLGDNRWLYCPKCGARIRKDADR